MAKQSAGLLIYRRQSGKLEVLIVHPGGPFWAKKDKAAWSIPKGEFEGSEGLEAAKREFEEELGQPAPDSEYTPLDSVKNKSGKTIYAWAAEGDLDTSVIRSNTFTAEWSPKSGNQQEYPEVDKAGWFGLEAAAKKLNPAQTAFLDRLAEALGIDTPEQTKLL